MEAFGWDVHNAASQPLGLREVIDVRFLHNIRRRHEAAEVHTEAQRVEPLVGKKGDVIVKLNGQAESDSNDLRNTISQMSPGTQVKLDIWRDGKVQPFTVTLGELPKDKETAESSDDSSSGEIQGIDVQDLTPEISQQLNLPSGTHGVVVTSVDPASAAAAAGINRGDLIQEINHKPVTSASQYKQLMSGASGQPILLLINRGGITSFVVVEAH